MSTARQLTRLSLLAILACAVVYAVAFGTRWGLRADARAFPSGTTGITWQHAHAALQRAIDTVHVITIALAAVAAGLAALFRRRRDLAAVAIFTLLGANLTTYVLKPLLAHADPLGGEAVREIGAAFPSGHATAAMSLALVAVIVAPRRWRGWVALAAAGYAGCVGVGLVLTFNHYPSDVVAGFLVAGAWATAMAAIALNRREHGAPVPARPIISPGAMLVGLGLAVAAGGLLLAPARHLSHGVFAVSAVVIAGLALLLPLALTLVLARERRAGQAAGGAPAGGDARSAPPPVF
jgi:membrane-associated phospholipid phosphatase